MKASDWIIVKDRLPKKNERVLVCKTFSDETSFTTIATYTGKEKIHDLDHYWWFTDEGFDIDGITHWQLIVLPKKKRKVMTREEQIIETAKSIYSPSSGIPQSLPMRVGFIEGAKWADKTMIEKACEWLLQQEEMIGISFEKDFIERFKKAMEE